MDFQTKRDQARDLIKAGQHKKAMGFCKTFDKIYNKDERRTLEIAFECLGSNRKFYENLKIDTNAVIEEAKELLNKRIK